MIRPETLKILLVIALHRDWAIRQWDQVAAYLQTSLQHDVYVADINGDGEAEYWKLDKALYGLKQAGHEWFKTLSKILGILGMHQCIGDEGTYTNITEQRKKEGPIIIGTHVDAHPRKEFWTMPRKPWSNRWNWTSEDSRTCCIGTMREKLTQTRLIESLVNQHLKEIGGKNSLPSNPDAYQKVDETGPRIETKRYQAIIGGLLFIARMSRPKISVHVNLLGRRTKDATDKYLKTALQVLRYLHSTKNEGITLCKQYIQTRRTGKRIHVHRLER